MLMLYLDQARVIDDPGSDLSNYTAWFILAYNINCMSGPEYRECYQEMKQARLTKRDSAWERKINNAKSGIGG
jgi:hypothetical protein